MRRPSIALILVALAASCGGDGPAANRTMVAVQITTASATLRPGESSQFTAVGIDADGIAIPNAGAVTWETAAASVATVSSSGLVQAVAIGSVSITARINGLQGSRLVNVLPEGVGAVISMPGYSFVPFTANITRGQTVYFEFPSEPHNAIWVQQVGAPADIPEARNTTITRTFGTAGSFAYDCTLHPGMSGVIVVAP